MFGALFHSYVFSQIFGLYFIIIAIVLLSRMRHYREVINRLDPFSPSLFLNASFWLLLGLFMVVVHNIWVWEPRVVVTIIGWLILIKSVLWLALPNQMVLAAKSMYLGLGFYIMIIVALIIGVFLLVKGFYLFIPPSHLEYSVF